MAGSSTAYHGLILIVKTEWVHAGDELFFDYTSHVGAGQQQQQLMPSPHYSYLGYHHQHDDDNAEDDDDENDDESIYRNTGPTPLPTAADYERADRIVRDLWVGYQPLGGNSTTSSGTPTVMTHAQWIGKRVCGAARRDKARGGPAVVPTTHPLTDHGALPQESNALLRRVSVSVLFFAVSRRRLWLRMLLHMFADLLYRLRTEILMHGESVPDGAETEWRDRTVLASLLPRTGDEMERAYNMGTDRYRLLPSPNLAGLLDGSDGRYFCLDHLREGTSTVAGAGNGAFATQKFEKGSVVTVAPLVYIPNKENAMKVKNDGGNNNTVQLLENYCFGHRHANLLLCPTTHAALINHQHGAGRANVELRWARGLNPPSLSDRADVLVGELTMLDVEASDLSSFAATRLMFEYVAVEDIEPGDEIILDYGDHYERALQEHKEKNNHRLSTSNGSPAVDVLNSDKWPIVSSKDPFMKQGYAYECRMYPNVLLDEGSGWQECGASSMMETSNWQDNVAAMYGKNDFASWYPCKVGKIADERRGLYNVVVYTKGNAHPPKVTRRLLNCKRSRIRYVLAPYQSNQHLPWAFRHYLPIPDEIFPLRWRNDYKPRDVWKLGQINEEAGEDVDYEESVRNATCGMYLAESNIPNSGFGLYTAVDIPSEGLVIGSNLPAVIHNGKDIEGFRWPAKDYYWSGNDFKMSEDGHPEFDVSFMFSLFGALPNYHPGLVNMRQKSIAMRPEIDRRVHHGAGAFSYFQNSGFLSDQSIGAGEELFIRYVCE